MTLMWRGLSLVFVAIFVLAVVIQLRTWRRQRRIRPVLVGVSQVAAVAASIGFSVLTRRPPEADVWAALFAVGLAGGWLYGGLMNVDRTERGIVMSYSFPAIITWTVLMTVTQLSSILSRSVPELVFSLAILNLGINVGMNGRVLRGYSRFRVGPAVGLLAVVALAVLPVFPAGAQLADGVVAFEGLRFRVDLPDWEACHTVFEASTGEEFTSCVSAFYGNVPDRWSSTLYVDTGTGIGHAQFGFTQLGYDQPSYIASTTYGFSWSCDAPVAESGRWVCSNGVDVWMEGLSNDTMSFEATIDVTIAPNWGSAVGTYSDPGGTYSVVGFTDFALVGEYRGSYDIGPDVDPIPVTVVVDEDLSVTCTTDATFESRDGLQTNTFRWMAAGSVEASGSLICSGQSDVEYIAHDAGTCTDVGESQRECIVSGSDSMQLTLTGDIHPDGTITGIVCADDPDCLDFAATAILGGPGAAGPIGSNSDSDVGADGTTATPGVVPTPLPGDTESGDFRFGSSGYPPLEPKDAAAATALAAFLLAGGSMAQLLPLTEGGMSLVEALRSVVPGAGSVVDRLPPLSDGRVMYQPPWERGGPIPMDPDWVREIEEMKRRGLRWTDRWGWTTPDLGEALQVRDDTLWRGHVDDHGLVERIVESDRKLAEMREQAARTADEIRRTEAQIADAEGRLAELHVEMSDEATLGEALTAVAGGSVATVGLVADATVSMLSWSVGPAGHAVRVGYNYAKGYGSVLGRKIALGTDLAFSEADVGQANTLGDWNLMFDYGADLTLRGAGRAINLARGIPGVPLKQVAVEQFVPRGLQPALIRKILPADLVATRTALDGVLSSVDDITREALDPQLVRDLYRNGGMKELARLEAAGGITRAEAAALNKALTATVDDTVAGALPEAAELFQQGNPGVRLREVLIGDAGSSARGGARSVLTDADRTIVGSFDPDDVLRYARNRNISAGEAYAELNDQLTQIYKKRVEAGLGRAGLALDDVGFEAYSGLGGVGGSTPGGGGGLAPLAPADSYPAGFTSTTQGISGNGLSYRPGGRVHRVGGEAIVDQWKLGAHEVGAATDLSAPRISVSQDFRGIAGQQAVSAEKAAATVDVRGAAKALQRTGYMAERTAGRGGPGVDRGLLRLARDVRGNPQEARAIMRASGMTDEQFTSAVLSEVRGYRDALELVLK